MIPFTCACGKSFSVPDEFAGRTARCKACGNSVTVPRRDKLPVRLRRLLADAAQIADKFSYCPYASVIDVQGDPPEIYKVKYAIRSIEKLEKGDPVFRNEHIAEIQLTSDYPRQAPKCRLLTPIFHPNFDETTICVGDHWAAGERLSDLVVRIAEMLAFQAYNIRSPLNGQAAMWVDLHPNDLPTDRQNFHADAGES